MKIAFVFAPFWSIKYPPLALALLSAVLKENGHEVIKIDINIELYLKATEQEKNNWFLGGATSEKNLADSIVSYRTRTERMLKRITDSGANIVCFTLYDANRPFTHEIANLIKARDSSKKVIFGGAGCYFSAEELVKDNSVDFVIEGEGEETLPELVNYIANGNDYSTCKGIYFKKDGKIVYTGKRAEISNLNNLPFPDYSGNIRFYKFKEHRILPIQASRGCINHCAFCNDMVYSKKYRVKSPERVFEEMLYLRNKYSASWLLFHDSLINGDMNMLERLCDMLIEEKLKNAINMKKSETKTIGHEIFWSGMAVIRPEMDSRMLNKMKQAGCGCLQYGIESGSRKILKKINKNLSIDRAITVIKDTHKAGISCLVNIMFGLPFEEEKDFQETLDFLKEVSPYIEHVVSSKAFCYLCPGSDMDSKPSKYGIKHKHPMYWESCDGKNTYNIRLNRYDKYLKYAKTNGIKDDTEITLSEFQKALLFKKYLKYKSIQT